MREAETGRASPMGYRGVNCKGREPVWGRGGGVGCRSCKQDRSPVAGTLGVFLAARRIALLQHTWLGGVQEKSGQTGTRRGKESGPIGCASCVPCRRARLARGVSVCALLSRLHQRARCDSRLAGCGRHRAGRALELREE